MCWMELAAIGASAGGGNGDAQFARGIITLACDIENRSLLLGRRNAATIQLRGHTPAHCYLNRPASAEKRHKLRLEREARYRWSGTKTVKMVPWKRPVRVRKEMKPFLFATRLDVSHSP